MEEKNIQLKVAEVYRMKLEELSTAGYTWHVETNMETDIVSVKLEPLSSREKKAIGGLDNAGILLSITAIAPGKTTVNLRLQRSWEEEKAPLKEICLNISVSS